MLNLRENQVRAFNHLASEAFERKISGFLRKYCPDLVSRFDACALDLFIKASCQDARKHGVVNERGVVKWTVMSFVVGRPIGEVPEVSSFLAGELSPENSVDDLLIEFSLEIN